MRPLVDRVDSTGSVFNAHVIKLTRLNMDQVPDQVDLDALWCHQ